MEGEMWNVKAVLTAFGGTAAIVAACVWLARTLLTQLLKKDFESFKNQLHAVESQILTMYKQTMRERWEEDKREWERQDVKLARWLVEKRMLYGTVLKLQAKGRDVAYVHEALQSVVDYFSKNPAPAEDEKLLPWQFATRLQLLELMPPRLVAEFKSNPRAFAATLTPALEAAASQLERLTSRTVNAIGDLELLAPHDVSSAAMNMFFAWRYADGDFNSTRRAFANLVREDLGVPAETTAKQEQRDHTRYQIQSAKRALERFTASMAT